MALNYEQLLSFATFADVMNFTRAAERLHISQPALHVQIKKLQEAVGRPLYRREGRALVLTPEGERLASFGREVAERGRAVLAEVRGGPAGPVVLAAGAGALHYLLGPALRRFPKRTWPLRVLAVPGADAVRALRDARAHAAVIAGDPPPDLTATALREVGQHVVVPTGHPLAERRTVEPRQLAGEDIIVAPAGAPHRMLVEHALAGVAWTPAVEVTGWELMLALARDGLGIAIVNDFCPPPRGMVAVPLRGAATVTYHWLERTGFSFAGTETLRRLVVDSVLG